MAMQVRPLLREIWGGRCVSHLIRNLLEHARQCLRHGEGMAAGNAWSCDPFGAAGPAATGTRRLAGARGAVARPSGAPAGSICAALPLKPATVLFEGDDPRAYVIASALIEGAGS